ncbi:uncharacterized protein LOC125645971 [Ostrea edulis]|uniref:uncharacterized protein LOC125645971 n=1 Tax=Ostrea edulis TaxID=37623 RepID=UPI0024AEE478|nr:uncharacterized protein LOC125645971 [Ostrea edulis]
MEKIQLLTIILISSGIVLMAISFGVGVASLLGEYWIDYAFTTTTSATVNGMPATVNVVGKANIGLFTTCYNVDTTTTVTSIFGSSTTTLNANNCVDSDTTGYLSKDTVQTIQSVGQVAGVFLGLGLVAGIVVLVLFILKKLAKPLCFATLVPAVLAFISAIMLISALVVLNGELTSDMKLSETSNLGIVSLVFAILATVAYSVAAAFIIKGALVAKTGPMKEQSTTKDENITQSEDKSAEATP